MQEMGEDVTFRIVSAVTSLGIGLAFLVWEVVTACGGCWLPEHFLTRQPGRYVSSVTT